MCSSRPKMQAAPATPAPLEPVAPLVSAEDPNLSSSSSRRRKGRAALRVTSSAPSGNAVSGLNIP